MNGFVRNKTATHELALALLRRLHLPAKELKAEGIASRLLYPWDGEPWEYLAVVTSTWLIFVRLKGWSNKFAAPETLSKASFLNELQFEWYKKTSLLHLPVEVYPLDELRLKTHTKRTFLYRITLQIEKKEVIFHVHRHFKKNDYTSLAQYLCKHIKAAD